MSGWWSTVQWSVNVTEAVVANVRGFEVVGVTVYCDGRGVVMRNDTFKNRPCPQE